MTRSQSNRRRTARARARGTAMVEGIFVISIFILFFMGMVYFRSVYEQKLRITRLARAAAVGYALGGCTGNNPLAQVSTDLQNATNQGAAGSQQGTGTGPSGATGGNPSVGSGNPVSGAESDKGTFGDPITEIQISGPAAGTSKAGMLGPTLGFRATVGTTSFMSCGETREDGSVGGALKYVKNLFSGSGL